MKLSMMGLRRGLVYILFLSLVLLPLVSTTRGATTTTTNDCHDTAEALQAAINLVRHNNGKLVDLWLCSGDDDDGDAAVVVVKEPIRIVDDRSIRIGCRRRRSSSSSSDSDYIEEEDVFCTLKSHQDRETRLFEMITSTSSSSSNRKKKKTPTVQLNHLRLEDGESYHEPGAIPAVGALEEQQQSTEGQEAAGGGAILARGYNLVLEDCQLINNVASQKGGALSVYDDVDQPILLLLTRTIFQDNLSIGVDAPRQDEEESDCHSLYFQQSHPGTTVELNTENDFLPSQPPQQDHGSSRTSSSLDYWDDPAQAAQALQSFTPGRAGSSLCF